MTRYIDAEEFWNNRPENFDPQNEYARGWNDCNSEYFNLIENAPTADVAPVVHARWIGVRDGCGICSNCNRQDGVDPLATNCRYCGAKMDLEG